MNKHTHKPAEKPYWIARRVLDRVVNITAAENLRPPWMAGVQKTQERLFCRLRTRINPPELMLTPEVGPIGPIEFYRAKDAIAGAGARPRKACPGCARLIQSHVHSGAPQ